MHDRVVKIGFITTVVAVVMGMGIGLLMLGRFVLETNDRAQCRQQTTERLYALARKRPPDVSQAEWEYLVGWTINGHANCVSSNSDVSLKEYRLFLQMVSDESAVPQLNIAFFDRVWDFYERAGPTGRRYTDMHRPTLPERLREAEKGCFGITVE